MSFKENLLGKIKLDHLRIRVLSSIGTYASGIKLDKNSMKGLLKAAGFRYLKIRNIEMYISDEAEEIPDKGKEDGKKLVFVLDNELAIYNTTVNDVALRKEPTLKEMISIKNAIKILNDNDVLVSKREKSLETIYKKSLIGLDLAFTASDIKQLEYDGRAAVEWKDSDSLLEVLSLFSELLDYHPAPKVLRLEEFHIRGMQSYDNDEEFFGPSFVYRLAEDSIKIIKEKINIQDKERVDFFREIAEGKRESFCEGTSVIKYLADEVLKKHNRVR